MAEQLHAPIPEDERFVTIPLFESAHAGFGDAQEVQDFRYNRIHGSIDARWPGQVRAGLQVRSVANSNWDRVPVFAHPWRDVQSPSQPQLYIFVQDELWGLRHGTLTQSSTANVLGENATTGMMHDNGSAVPLLYAGFGNTGQNIRSITRFTLGGDPTVVAASGTLRATILYSLNGRAYRTVLPTGGQEACQISTLPVGADPITAANWGTPQLVGQASTPINAITAVRHLPVAVKPEGIFMYNEGLDRWVNQTIGWVGGQHPLTGKGAYSLGNQAVIPLGDGGAVLFDGWNVTPFDPLGPNASPNVHTTTNQIDATASMKNWILSVSGNTGEAAGGRAAKTPKSISGAAAMRVFHFNNTGSTYTDIGANLRDLDTATTATFTIDETTDYLYIGWTRPFVEMNLRVFGSSNSNAATVTAEVGQSGGTYTSVSVRDFTSVAGASLDGQDKIIMTEDPVGVKNWEQTTVNSVTLYWVRLSWSASLSEAVTLHAIYITPWYPSVDNTNFPLDGLDKAGVLPHILFGTKDRGNAWHDMCTIPEPDDIGAVVYFDAGGSGVQQSRSIVAVGRYRIWQFDVHRIDSPGTEAAPYINDVGLIESAAMVPAPGRLCRLVTVRINGLEADPNLLGRFYYTWDYGKPWNKAAGAVQRFPALLKINQQTRGYRIRWAWGWSQSSDTALLTQPALTEIEATFEILPDEIDTIQERALASEPRI